MARIAVFASCYDASRAHWSARFSPPKGWRLPPYAREGAGGGSSAATGRMKVPPCAARHCVEKFLPDCLTSS